MAPTIYCQYCSLKHKNLYLTLSIAAKISPIHKKNNKSDIEIYRPVSFLCKISKLLERIIFRRLYEHLSPMFHRSQHGFRKNKSTVLQLLISYRPPTKVRTKRVIWRPFFTDFSKAFDRVDYGILSMKLFKSGVGRNLIKLLNSYLSNRSQSVKVNREISDPKPVTSGMPQVSILGSLFFLIFLNNDLSSLCQIVTPLLFADDAKFISQGLGKEEFQNELNVTQLDNWKSKIICHSMLINAPT